MYTKIKNPGLLKVISDTPEILCEPDHINTDDDGFDGMVKKNKFRTVKGDIYHIPLREMAMFISPDKRLGFVLNTKEGLIVIYQSNYCGVTHYWWRFTADILLNKLMLEYAQDKIIHENDLSRLLVGFNNWLDYIS